LAAKLFSFDPVTPQGMLVLIGPHGYAIRLGCSVELAQVGQDYRSTAWSDFIHVNFENRSDETIQMYWYDYSGNL